VRHRGDQELRGKAVEEKNPEALIFLQGREAQPDDEQGGNKENLDKKQQRF
jgi:hypothetical protein